jgi:NADH dehydrogenase FAD-containing subunit
MFKNYICALSVYLPNRIHDFINEKNPREKVYIVGNGWATYYFVKYLNKLKFEPIIIAPNSKVLNTPKLVDRLINPNTIVEFPNPYGEKIIDMVEDIDIDKKILKTKSGSTYAYNRVVFAIGSEPNDFGIPGVNEYTYKLKTIQDADVIGKKLHQDMGINSTIYIIGSGITGIELASKIEQKIFGVKVIEGLKEILPGSNEKTKTDIVNYFIDHNKYTQLKLSHMVKSIGTNRINMEINMEINTKNKLQKTIINESYISNKDMIIWTGGVRFNGFGKTKLYSTLNSIVPIKPRGLDVEPDFSLKGNNNSIYCLGDMVGNAGPPTAQNAKNQAIWLAEYFNSDFDSEYIKSNPYKIKSNGKLIHLANGTYLESEYYSGFVPGIISKIIEWLE